MVEKESSYLGMFQNPLHLIKTFEQSTGAFCHDVAAHLLPSTYYYYDTALHYAKSQTSLEWLCCANYDNKFPIPSGNLVGLNDTPPLGSRDVDDVVMPQVGTRHCRRAMQERMQKIQGVGCSNPSAHSFNFYLTFASSSPSKIPLNRADFGHGQSGQPRLQHNNRNNCDSM